MLSFHEVVLVVGRFTKESSTRIQDLTLREVSCQRTAGNPINPAKESIQATSPWDSTLAVCHEYNQQVPTKWSEGLEIQEGDFDHLTPYPVRPSYWPTQEERHQENQGQVTQWDKFSDVCFQPREQLRIFGPRHCHQASSRAEGDHPRWWESIWGPSRSQEAVRTTPWGSLGRQDKGWEGWAKKNLSAIKEDLKATHKLAVAETLKAYKLFHFFIVGEAQMQWDKII